MVRVSLRGAVTIRARATRLSGRLGKHHDTFDTALLWRQDNGYVGRGGVVVLFNGEVQSWVNKLRNPEHWQPGCIAVDEEGHTWTTIASDEHDGALMWLANDEL